MSKRLFWNEQGIFQKIFKQKTFCILPYGTQLRLASKSNGYFLSEALYAFFLDLFSEKERRFMLIMIKEGRLANFWLQVWLKFASINMSKEGWKNRKLKILSNAENLCLIYASLFISPGDAYYIELLWVFYFLLNLLCIFTCLKRDFLWQLKTGSFFIISFLYTQKYPANLSPF